MFALMLALAAAPPVLELPVACVIGETCLVQKLVDLDPSPARADYRCGLLTTDGHDGVDIRVRTMADMAGTKVLAAAAGIVRRSRDGEPDISVRERGDLGGRDAGNGLVIDHGNGWESQYSHLRNASLRVRPGDRVEAGDVLGEIGLSGNSEFPHLHFSLRHNGRAIDPFSGGETPGSCSARSVGNGLWSRRAAQALRYTPSAVIATGLAPAPPPRAVTARATLPALSRTLPLILWADVIGAAPGDVESFEIRGPDAAIIVAKQTKLTQGGLSWFAYHGLKPPAAGWAAGRYTGRYTLSRAGKPIETRTTQSDIR